MGGDTRELRRKRKAGEWRMRNPLSAIGTELHRLLKLITPTALPGTRRWLARREQAWRERFLATSSVKRLVDSLFGSWLEAHGFKLSNHDINWKVFGNELIDYDSPVMRIRFLSDRSVPDVDLASNECPESWVPLPYLLRLLGHHDINWPSDAEPRMRLLSEFLQAEYEALKSKVGPASRKAAREYRRHHADLTRLLRARGRRQLPPFTGGNG